MKNAFIALTLLATLTGCSAISNKVGLTTEQVTLVVACEEMRGKIGNSCSITVPEDATVDVNGETIEIHYDR